ncbi:MAG: Dyp-type peroxidase [Solirubrobacteraceae bacterium]
MAVNPQPTPGPSDPDPQDIQGNMVGFNKDHQRLVFLGFPDTASGKAFLQAITPEVATATEVREFNALYKEVRSQGADEGTVEATWLNFALSAAGLKALGAPGLGTLPIEFTQGMAAQAQTLGDLDSSAPAQWLPPFNTGASPVHAMVILAADSSDDLQGGYTRLQAKIAAAHVTELGHQDGNTRTGNERGHEHFGFKDGISQPGIAGITQSVKDGTDTIATGEFIIGYAGQDGHISGQSPPPGPPPQPGPGYPGPAPAPAPSTADWMKNGSFVVYRRLRQDVGAFNQFVTQQAQALGMDPELLAAKLVGRWRSGAPMESVPALPAGVNPATTDPATASPAVLNDDQINNFDYEPGDADGSRVPRAAHIRKVNPRSSNPPGKPESNRHRMLRRGIPYGPEFQPNEQPYSHGPVGDDRDRGLLFLCYQASLARSFNFVQQSWVNPRDFPQGGDGEDPIISQALQEREFNLPPQATHMIMARWVFTTGGEFFFSPSISALTQLGTT